jgi:DMSO/TMAO reductase YedYZ molybdopterin-dependent catalytic subunit
MFLRRKSRFLNPPGLTESDTRALLRDAVALLPNPARRQFLRGAVGLGSLTLLTGCAITDGPSAEEALKVISRFNDRMQAWLFDPETLAPSFAREEITRPFPFNAYYSREEAPEIEAKDWALETTGKVQEARSWTLADFQAMPQETQITKHICIEGWSAIGQWTGVPLRHFLERIGADLSAPYVAFQCADDYSTSLDMATALHPQTQMTIGFDGGVLPRIYGFPMKIRVPTKLGFKNPKHVIALEVTDEYREGFWEAYGYNWHSGL